MKKLFFLSAATIFMAMAASAQSSESPSAGDQGTATKAEKKEERKEARKNEVGFQSKEQFYRDFGDVTSVNWDRMGSYDKASFTKDGQTVSAFYDYNSELLGTTTSKTMADLPAKAQEYIKDKYKDYEVKDVLFFDDNEYNETDMELYGVEFQNADNYFVELQKDNKEIILQSNIDGQVFFFKQVK